MSTASIHAGASSRLLTLSIALLLNPALPAFAADAQDGIDNVVVTANRIEQPAAKVADAVTIISAKELRASQKTALSDLLAMTAGVSVTRNGGLGSPTTLRIRGAETDHTVVLIDGVKLNDPASAGGGYNFGNLIANEYSRIEILRGPQSTLWGSQAIGGVVNIVTPVPDGPLSASMSAEGGTHDTAFVRASAEAGDDRFAWRMGGDYLTTDGISAFAQGRESDSYRNVGFNARGILYVTENVSAEVRSTWSDSHGEFDGFPPPNFTFDDTPEYSDTEELVTYVGVNLTAWDGRFENRVGFAYTDTDREFFDPSSSVPLTFDADGSNKRWEYQGTLRVSDAVTAVLGLESERSEMNSASPTTFDPNPVPTAGEVELNSAYAQLTVSPIDALTLSAGLRHDDHETFGDHTTGRASAAWSVTSSTILRATYGEGFKAPTLYQLYSPYGNSALDAEQAEAWDAGIEQHLFGEKLVLGATYFDRDTTNAIDFVSCFGVSTVQCQAQPDGYYDNVQKSESKGIELTLVAQLVERLMLTANYTAMDAENAVRGSVNFGRSLARRPNETANMLVSYEWPLGLTTALAVQRAGRSYNDAANNVVLDAYTVVDLRASYAVSKSLEVFGRVENLFADDYETAPDYGTLGRTFFGGVRQSF